MGGICGAYAVSHATFQQSRTETVDGETVARIDRAWTELEQRLAAAQPHALVVISRDHMQSLSFANYPTFLIGTAPAYRTWGEAGLPRHVIPGHQALARQCLEDAVAAEFDLAFSDDIRLDHAFAFPLQRLRPQMDLPVIPLFLNGLVPPFPSLARCYRLGEVLRRTVEHRFDGDVAVLATGGLSHWVGVPEMGKVNEAFDRHCLDLMRGPNLHELLAITPAEIAEQLGNGGHELEGWATMLGASGGQGAEVLAYEAVPEWASGIALIDATGDQSTVPASPAPAVLSQPEREGTGPFALQHAVWRILHEPAVRARIIDGETDGLDVAGLDQETVQAIRDLDIGALHQAGVAPMLLYPLSVVLGRDFSRLFAA